MIWSTGPGWSLGRGFGRRLAAAVTTLGALGSVLAVDAGAGTGLYVVRSCTDYNGTGLGAAAWTGSVEQGGPGMLVASTPTSCPSGEWVPGPYDASGFGIAAVLKEGAGGTGGSHVSASRWFQAPEGTRIVDFEGTYACDESTQGQVYTGFHWLGGPRMTEPCTVDPMQWTEFDNDFYSHEITGVRMVVGCTAGAPGDCKTGGAGMFLGQSRVSIEDPVVPSVQITGGTLFDGAFASGQKTVTFDAQDNVGIHSARLIVDEVAVDSRTFACDYSQTVPCSDKTGVSFTVNTELLTDDEHDVEIEVKDGAGNITLSVPEPFESHNGPPSHAPVTWATLGSGEQPLYGDVNGDGAADLVTYNPSNGALSARLSDGTTFTAGGAWGTWPSAGSLALGDVDMDGLADLAGRTGASNDILVRISSGTAFGTGSTWLSGAAGALSLADIDGDEAADAALEPASSGTVRGAWSEDGGFRELFDWATGVGGTRSFADVDGDGDADLVTVGETSGEVRVRLSDGSSFTAGSTWATIAATTQARFGDIDSDGMDDLVLRSTGGEIAYRPSTGTSFGTAKTWGTLTTADDWRVADVTADGRGDVVIRHGAQIKVMVGGVAYAVGDTDVWEPGPDEPEDPDDGGAFGLMAAPPNMRLGWGAPELVGILATDPNDPGLINHVQTGLNRIAQAGGRWYRMTILWGRYEEQENYRLAVRRVAEMARNMPDPYPDLTVHATLTSSDYDTPVKYHIDPEPTDFADFVTLAVGDLKNVIDRWAMWNEPNLERYLINRCTGPGQSGKASTVVLYRQLYREGRAAVMAEDPGALVYLGELAELREKKKPTCESDPRPRRTLNTLEYLERVVDTDSGVEANAVAWHAYAHYAGPRRRSKPGRIGIHEVERFQRKISELYARRSDGTRRLRTPGGNRPSLYITEFGYHNSTQNQGGIRVAWPESTRARFYHQALTRALNNTVRLFLFWELGEKFSNFDDWDDNGNDWDTGVLAPGDYSAGGSRLYGKRGNRMTNDAQPRKAYCRVLRWAAARDYDTFRAGTGCA